jgi:2-isopropylmalate synthase
MVNEQRIKVFDTTLRDGEQAAGSRLGINEKLEIAKQLQKLNVDVIEAGFPISSPMDFDAVRAIAKEIRGPVICGLTRAIPKDIDICGEALQGAEKSRIHTGIGVSDIHVIGKFRDDRYGRTLIEKRNTVIDMSVTAIKHALKYTDDVEFYAEDAGRAAPEYLFQIIKEVIDAGARVINIPDTTGYAIPEQFGELIYNIKTKVPNMNKGIISVHCHNDLGMAVGNTLSAIKNGAGQIEGTINGIGERAGNAAIEEVVMAMKTRKDYFNVDTNINTKEFYTASRMVADKLGMNVPHNKAVVGKNAFAHSSGIHVDGFLKERTTYEIIKPEDVGFPESKVILTARTGRHGVKHRLEELKYEFAEEEFEQIYQRFLIVADKKKEVSDDDLIAIVGDEIKEIEEKCKLEYMHTVCGTGTIPSATVKLDIDGKRIQESACGDGAVDAAYKAINSMMGNSCILHKYEIHGVSEGTDALGTVTVSVEKDGLTVFGKGSSTDIIEASAKAYINAINKIYSLKK